MALMSSLVHCGTKIYESASALIRLWYVKSSLRSHFNDGYYRQNKYTYFKIILFSTILPVLGTAFVHTLYFQLFKETIAH